MKRPIQDKEDSLILWQYIDWLEEYIDENEQQIKELERKIKDLELYIAMNI